MNKYIMIKNLYGNFPLRSITIIFVFWIYYLSNFRDKIKIKTITDIKYDKSNYIQDYAKYMSQIYSRLLFDNC